MADRVVTIVDTPGYDDTTRTEVEVLEEVASWLTSLHTSQKLLSGIIYMHPITSNPVTSPGLQNLDVYAKLVGPNSFHNIHLVTTMWDLLPGKALGEAREAEICESFWNGFNKNGAITARSYGNKESALAILKRVAFDQRMARTGGALLTIQREMVDEHKVLKSTSAGEALARSMDEMEQHYKHELARVEAMSQLERSMAQAERTEMQRKLENLEREPARLNKGHEVQQQRERSNLQGTEQTKTEVPVQWSMKELLEMEPPQSYVSAKPPMWRQMLDMPIEVTLTALVPFFVLQEILEPPLRKILRPRLRPEYSRLEWTNVGVSHPVPG